VDEGDVCAGVGVHRAVGVAQATSLDHLLDLGQRLGEGRGGPGTRLTGDDLVEGLRAADAISEVLDPHEVRPLGGTRLSDRDVTGVLELGDERHELVPGGGHLDADLLEGRLGVVEEDGLGVVVGQGVDLAVDLADLQQGRNDAGLGVRRRAGDVDDLVVGDVVSQRAARPVVQQGRGVAGADGGADLLLVGVVGEPLGGELGVRMGLVPAVEGVTEGLLGATGEHPRRRAASSSTARLRAAAGREGGGHARSKETGAGLTT